jgi:hypothetical protein
MLADMTLKPGPSLETKLTGKATAPKSVPTTARPRRVSLHALRGGALRLGSERERLARPPRADRSAGAGSARAPRARPGGVSEAVAAPHRRGTPARAIDVAELDALARAAGARLAGVRGPGAVRRPSASAVAAGGRRAPAVAAGGSRAPAVAAGDDRRAARRCGRRRGECREEDEHRTSHGGWLSLGPALAHALQRPRPRGLDEAAADVRRGEHAPAGSLGTLHGARVRRAYGTTSNAAAPR